MKVFPAIDIINGKCVRLIKGDFNNKTEYEASPVDQAGKYERHGFKNLHVVDLDGALAGEIVNLDIIQDIVSKFDLKVEIGGGIRNIDSIHTIIERVLDDISKLLNCGADKVSINTAAVNDPNVVVEGSKKFGSQCIVVAIDAKQSRNKWEVFTHGGRKNTGIDAVEFAKKMENSGAGELLVTSMDRDGTQVGFDIDLTSTISKKVNIPLIASGGAGNLDHLVDGIKLGNASAVLAASIFHYGKYSLKEAKEYLDTKGIPVRI